MIFCFCSFCEQEEIFHYCAGIDVVSSFAHRHDIDINSPRQFMLAAPEGFSNDPFKTISFMGLTMLFGDSNPQTWPFCMLHMIVNDEMRTGEFSPSSHDSLELFMAKNSYALRKSPFYAVVRRLRPCLRLRLMTWRPFASAILLRKPQAFCLLILLGW